MTFERITTVLGLVIALAGLAVALAQASPEARTQLAIWWSKLYRVARALFIFIALGNGAFGVLLFAIASTPPSRMDIIHLLMFILNIATGIAMIWESAGKSQVTTAK